MLSVRCQNEPAEFLLNFSSVSDNNGASEFEHGNNVPWWLRLPQETPGYHEKLREQTYPLLAASADDLEKRLLAEVTKNAFDRLLQQVSPDIHSYLSRCYYSFGEDPLFLATLQASGRFIRDILPACPNITEWKILPAIELRQCVDEWEVVKENLTKVFFVTQLGACKFACHNKSIPWSSVSVKNGVIKPVLKFADFADLIPLLEALKAKEMENFVSGDKLALVIQDNDSNQNTGFLMLCPNGRWDPITFPPLLAKEIHKEELGSFIYEINGMFPKIEQNELVNSFRKEKELRDGELQVWIDEAAAIFCAQSAFLKKVL